MLTLRLRDEVPAIRARVMPVMPAANAMFTSASRVARVALAGFVLAPAALALGAAANSETAARLKALSLAQLMDLEVTSASSPDEETVDRISNVRAVRSDAIQGPQGVQFPWVPALSGNDLRPACLEETSKSLQHPSPAEFRSLLARREIQRNLNGTVLWRF